MTPQALAEFLRALDVLDGREEGQGYGEVADEVAALRTEREISLYLQRLDFLAGRLADHPKYFEYLARWVLGITPNPHPDEVER